MNRFILLFLMTPLLAWSTPFQCQDSDGGHNIFKAGKVVYSLGGEHCLQDDCFNQLIKEHDRCKSESEVLEFSCGANQLIEKVERCPDKCVKGRCLK